MKVLKVKRFGFYSERIRIRIRIKAPQDYWFILMTNPSQTKPLTQNFILDLLSKDKFLLSLSHLLSVSVSVFLQQPHLFSWLIAIEILEERNFICLKVCQTILMFRNPCQISLVPISKLLLSMLRFDICDDELTSTNPPLLLYEFDTC